MEKEIIKILKVTSKGKKFIVSIDTNDEEYKLSENEIVSNRTIKSWKKGGHGLQTYLEVLQNSSNPGFVQISRKLGIEKMYQYVKDFGFLEKSQIDIHV